jgi:hypothetical protein
VQRRDPRDERQAEPVARMTRAPVPAQERLDEAGGGVR